MTTQIINEEVSVIGVTLNEIEPPSQSNMRKSSHHQHLHSSSHSSKLNHSNHHQHYRRSGKCLRSIVIALALISLVSRIIYATFATWFTINTFDCLPCNTSGGSNTTSNRLFVSRQLSTDFIASKGFMESGKQDVEDDDQFLASKPVRLKRDTDEEDSISFAEQEKRREQILATSKKSFDDIAKEWKDILVGVQSTLAPSTVKPSTGYQLTFKDILEGFMSDGPALGDTEVKILDEKKVTQANVTTTESVLKTSTDRPTYRPTYRPTDRPTDRPTTVDWPTGEDMFSLFPADKRSDSEPLESSTESDVTINMTTTISPQAQEFKFNLKKGSGKTIERQTLESDGAMLHTQRRSDWSVKVNSTTPKVDMKAINTKKRVSNTLSSVRKFDFNYPAIFSDIEEKDKEREKEKEKEKADMHLPSDMPNLGIANISSDAPSPALNSSDDDDYLIHSFFNSSPPGANGDQKLNKYHPGVVHLMPKSVIESASSSINNVVASQRPKTSRENVNEVTNRNDEDFLFSDEANRRSTISDGKSGGETARAGTKSSSESNVTCSHDCNRFLSIELNDPKNRKWAMMLTTGMSYLYALVMLCLFLGALCNWMDLLVIATFIEGAKLFVGFILLVIDNFNGKKIVFNLVDVRVSVDPEGKGWHANFTYSEYLLDLILFIVATWYAIKTVNNKYFARKNKCACVSPEDAITTSRGRGNTH